MDKFSAEDLFKSTLTREATSHEVVVDTLIEKLGFSAERAEVIAREASLSFQVLIKATFKDFEEQFHDPCERNMVFALFSASLLEWAREMEPMAVLATRLAAVNNGML